MHDVTPATASVIRLAKQEDRLEYAGLLIVHETRAADALLFFRSLTPRMIRREVEKILGLEEETLDSKPYKDAVKKAANAAMVSLDTSDRRYCLTKNIFAK